MRWLKSWVTGGADELGWDDLVRRVTRAVAATAHHGSRGRVVFPPEVEITVSVGDRGAEVVREFLQQPAFDRDVGAALANRTDCAAADLPLRSYRVEEGERLRARAREIAAASRWTLVIEGGDLDGRALEIPPGRTELRFGRGEWHGGDQQLKNDLIVSERCDFVSRRAGRLVFAGHLLEVESLDQGDFLTVRRGDGQSLRPARAASGRASLAQGDAIELGGGGEEAVRLILERRRI